MAEGEAPVLFVKGVCKLCRQQVWNNELRWKSYTPAGEYEGYVHKACHDQLQQKLIPEASLAGPPDAPNATLQQVAFSLEKTVSERLRDDGLGALKEVDSCIEMVKAGQIVTRFKKTLGFSREFERFVAVCPQTAKVYWTRQRPEALPQVDAENLDAWARTCQDCKHDKLVGVLPATAKHVADKHRERTLVLVTETTELVLAVKDDEAQRSWLSACHSILGRARDALLLAGVKAVETSRGKAEEKIADARAMEEAAAAAKAQAEDDAEAARLAASAEAAAAKAFAEAEVLAAQQRADAEAEQARAAAAEEAAAAKAAAEAELLDAQKQLDRAIKEHGGEKLQLREARECVVCFEDFLGFDDGVVCAATSDVHFVCNGCFLASVQSAITDTMAKQTMREGKIACPYSTFPPTANSCRSECFPDKTVAEKVDEQLFAAYQRQRDLLAEARCANEQRLEMDRRLDLAIKKMEQEGVKVFKARKFIEEEILTMHCPRCKMAFADWDGCNALYCTYAGCGCNFCAFCLKDCGGGVAHGQKEIVRRGDDPVHKHINSECKYAKGIGIGGGGKDRLQKEVWGKVRTDRIQDCLKDMCDTDGERQKVVDALKMQFKALDLTISVPKGGSGGGNAKAGAKVGAKSSVKSPTKSTARRKVEEAKEAPLQLPPGIKACPACGMLIEKVGGDDNVMCGCEAKAAGGTYEKALKGGGCGHQWNWRTLAPIDKGRPGNPANAKQVLFFLDELGDEEAGAAMR